MKQGALLQIYLLSIILLHCFCGCENQSYPQTLISADSLSSVNPDSAIAILTAMKERIAAENKQTQMYYQLICLKAKDKAYITHTSDNSILQILKYYEQKEEKKHLPEAYYYAGRVYRDLGDAPQALDYYQKALDVSQSSKDYKLISRIYSQMGTLYLYQRVYNEALSVFKKSYNYDILSNDSIGQIYSLRDIGRTFTGYNNADSSLFYYENAYKQAREIKNKHLTTIISGELASLYTQLGMYSQAEEAIRISMQAKEKRNLASRISTIADLYFKMNNQDSAYYYYHKLLEFDNYYTKQGGYEGLSNICKQNHLYKEALDYVDLYLAYTDSIKKQTDTETIRKMQSLYNYQLREKENQKLKDINAKQEAKVIGLIFILILSITSFLLYSQYTKRKREQKKEQQRRLQEIKERQYQKSIEFIEQNAKHIHFLETQLQVVQSEKDELKQELLEAQKELIENTNKQIEAEQKEQTLLESNLKRSDIYIHFHQAAKNQTNITAAEWNDLQAMIDQTYGMFTKRLYALFPQISEQELRICLLLKISISATGIANLTLRSKQAVTSSRKKLYEKTHGQQGGPEKWDQFIQAF